jgi:hypothetical protein
MILTRSESSALNADVVSRHLLRRCGVAQDPRLCLAMKGEKSRRSRTPNRGRATVRAAALDTLLVSPIPQSRERYGEQAGLTERQHIRSVVEDDTPGEVVAA